ncbi:general stress protein [Brachybacterium sp. UNK5269]|uniref:general stress protein n=1 Tax=Brachybacterium sp. UNK5269 TaxID=3408576 RepID=UPI003BAEF960
MTQTTATPQPLATTPALSTIATYSDYLEAQAAVDLLSDQGFEVGAVRIVGHDLKSVELVTGRMNYGKAALYGAGSGAWLGLLLGLLMALFLPGAFFLAVLTAVVFGAIWGAIFGLIGFAVTGQQRNFRSHTATKASSYTLEVPTERAQSALQVLSAGR